MKTWVVGAASVAVLIGVSACGDDGAPTVTPIPGGNETTSEPEPTSEEPTSEEPTSEEPTSEEPTSEEPTSEEPTSEEPTSEEPTSEEPTSEEPTSEEPTGGSANEEDLNSRGNIELEIGETGTILNADNEVVVEMTLTEISIPHTCTWDSADDSLNGQFLGLQFDIVITEAAEDEDPYFFDVNPYFFDIIDGETDEIEDDSIGNSYFCLDFDDELPYDWAAGDSVEGWVALDTGVDSGTLIYDPLTHYGFEWQF